MIWDGKGRTQLHNTSLNRVGVIHMVRRKPVAMSDHRRAAGYNFSQPACPEKKIAWAIPRPIPTLKSWFEGRGSSDHLVKLCYHLEY